jgi:hypothetical protein
MTGTPGTGVPASPPAPVPGPKTGNALAGLAKFLAQSFANLGLDAEVNRFLGEYGERVTTAQRWLGDQGLLLEFRIAEAITDPRYPRQYRLVSVRDHGIASTAKAALANTMRERSKAPHPTATVPSGFKESRERSFFLWIKADGEPTKVAWPSNAILMQEALRIDADRFLREQVLEQQVVDRWRALQQAAVTGIPEVQGRAAFERSVRAAADAYDEMRAINKRLAEAQEAARRSAAALEWLNTLGAVLDFATRIAEINQQLGEDALPSPVPINSQGDLINYVQSVNVRRQNGVLTIEQQKSTTIRNYEGRLQEVRNESKHWDIPESALPLYQR